MNNLIETLQKIVSQSTQLKNKYTDFFTTPVEFACIFCQNQDEYYEFTNELKSVGKVVEDTPTGFTYLLDKPISTISGQLSLVKIRKPDESRTEIGDADFNTDYEKFKKKVENSPNFELIKRDNFEMLRLSNSDFNVLACFSNIPKSKLLDLTI